MPTCSRLPSAFRSPLLRSLLLLGASLPALGAMSTAQAILDTPSGAQAGDHFGEALAAMDVDGDGKQELVVAAPFTNALEQGGEGFVRILDHQGTLLLEIDGLAQDGGRFGAAVDRAPDLDSDGRPDVLIGEPNHGAGFQGRVLIASSADGALLWEQQGLQVGSNLGSSVAALGDLDGDGVLDFAFTGRTPQTFGGDIGLCTVLSGASQAVLHEISWPGANVSSVASVGDVDGDGAPDFALGNAHPDGLVRVYSGATGLEVRVIPGPGAAESFGSSLAAAGDLNLDGVPDVLVGALGTDAGPVATTAGSVHAFSGANGAELWSVLGQQKNDSLGRDLDGARDVDLDGVSDALIGANTLIELRSGGTGGLLYRKRHDDATYFGFAVTYLDDWSGDGRPDLVAGAPRKYETKPGFAHVISLPGIDCDSDGVLDFEALANGLAPDCNLNGIPDACDLAVGASLDADLDGVPDECQAPLTGFPREVSLQTGGTHELTIHTDVAGFYFIVGSASGTSPGIPLGGLLVPLVPDAWFTYTSSHYNDSLLVNTYWYTDPEGVTTDPAIAIPAYGIDPGLAGLELFHAAVLIGADFAPVDVTNAVPLRLVP